VRVAAGYPGTPSTEILETLAAMPGVHAEWCPNEKVALDAAIGAAYAGARALAVMKHVGLNVAADSLFYAAMTGIEAGLVIVVADDPGMHSSQGEQDSRRYAKFARVPCLEPSDSQEAMEMMALALTLSETFDTPVMLRTATRIAHSCGVVELGPDRAPEDERGRPSYRIDPAKYVMVPAFARQRHPVMEARMARLAEHANGMQINRVVWGDRALGIISHGAAYRYAREVFPKASFLRLGMTYPLPARLVAEFAQGVERLVVVEELDPVIEEELKIMGIACEGKSIFPAIGELDPQRVRACAEQAGLIMPSAAKSMQPIEGLPPRPPVLCPGCPHRPVFALLRKLKVVVNGDIGCYTLGFSAPLSAVHTTGCMGASIGVAHGVAQAGIAEKNVAVIGDSTFLHSGIPALLNAAYNGGNATTIILDNRTTAMTGHQDHPGTGRTLQGQHAPVVALEPLVRALGLRQVFTVDPYHLEALEDTLRACLAMNEPSVLIASHPCVLLPEERGRREPMWIDVEACSACGVCLSLGCPAVSQDLGQAARNGRAVAQIDSLLCAGCGVCAQLCPTRGIAPKSARGAS
jgi:indolepyruvate ferredoxin oxidoreductase alpha subunit